MRKVSGLALVLGVLGLALAPAIAFADCYQGHSTKVSSTTTTTTDQTSTSSSVAETTTTSK